MQWRQLAAYYCKLIQLQCAAGRSDWSIGGPKRQSLDCWWVVILTIHESTILIHKIINSKSINRSDRRCVADIEPQSLSGRASLGGEGEG